MRIHRPNYQTRNAIQTELDWMRALNEAGIGTPQALPALDGTVLQRVTREPAGTRYVALFRWIDGGFPDPDKLDASQRHLGWLSARMHAQSRAPGGVPAISSAWSGTTPARWARPRIGDSGNARRA